jgi:hypothetical protein
MDVQGIAATLVESAKHGEDVARCATAALLRVTQARTALILYEWGGTAQAAIAGYGPGAALREYQEKWRPHDPIWAAMAATQLPVHDGQLYDC